MLGMPEIQTRLLAEAGRISWAGKSMASHFRITSPKPKRLRKPVV